MIRFFSSSAHSETIPAIVIIVCCVVQRFFKQYNTHKRNFEKMKEKKHFNMDMLTLCVYVRFWFFFLLSFGSFIVIVVVAQSRTHNRPIVKLMCYVFIRLYVHAFREYLHSAECLLVISIPFSASFRHTVYVWWVSFLAGIFLFFFNQPNTEMTLYSKRKEKKTHFFASCHCTVSKSLNIFIVSVQYACA